MQKLGSRTHNSAGDTIVEVMIALAILSLSFAISYATANRALLQARNAQEHSQALEYVNAQIELLREAAPDGASGVFEHGAAGTFGGVADSQSSTAFCLEPGASGVVPPQMDSFPTGNILTDLATANPPTPSKPYPAACTEDGLYYIYVLYNTAPDKITSVNQDVFQIYVHWQGLGSLGIQQEELTYKIHP